MKIVTIKKRMMNWRDFYGMDIPNKDDIEKCKNKKDCHDVLERYRDLMESTHCDAMKDLDKFEDELGL